MLAAAQQGGNCAAAMFAPAKPKIRTSRNNIVFQVDQENDALFRRTRQTSLSIFEMNEQLQAVSATIDGQASAFAMQRDIISNITAATGVALSRQVTDVVAQTDGTVQAAITGFTTRIENLW